MSLDRRKADFFVATQNTKVSISSLFISTLMCTWSLLGLINCPIIATKSCLLRNLSSTSMPSQHVRPLHHNVYKFSESFIRPGFSFSIFPSSPTRLKFSSSKVLCEESQVLASLLFLLLPVKKFNA